MRSRPSLLAVVALTAAVGLLLAAVALAAVSKPAVVRDAKEDVTGKLDLQKLKFSLGSDGRLRAAVTFAGKVTAADMRASSGPPGSVCIRIWTNKDADTANTRPDRLACVSAEARGSGLRASVFSQEGLGLPKRVASAAVTASKTRRSFIIYIPQSSLGTPERIQYSAESTRPGCDRPACIDTVPDAPKTRRFTLK